MPADQALALFRARARLLELAQAECTGRYDDARRMWPEVAGAVAVAGVGSPMKRAALARGLLSVRELLQLALRCSIVVNCSCGLAIDGLLWAHLEIVGVQRFDDGEVLELRNCTCGSTRAVVVVPPMKGAA